jgi:hypothetical protein
VNRREEAILRVAERCPVHETVASMDSVEISLNGDAQATPFAYPARACSDSRSGCLQSQRESR